MRPARRGDRWQVAKSEGGRWYAQPRSVGVWATRTAKQMFFSTHELAVSYATQRATQR